MSINAKQALNSVHFGRHSKGIKKKECFQCCGVSLGGGGLRPQEAGLENAAKSLTSL